MNTRLKDSNKQLKGNQNHDSIGKLIHDNHTWENTIATTENNMRKTSIYNSNSLLKFISKVYYY